MNPKPLFQWKVDLAKEGEGFRVVSQGPYVAPNLKLGTYSYEKPANPWLGFYGFPHEPRPGREKFGADHFIIPKEPKEVILKILKKPPVLRDRSGAGVDMGGSLSDPKEGPFGKRELELNSLTCKICDGTGGTEKDPCGFCGGKGVLKVNRLARYR